MSQHGYYDEQLLERFHRKAREMLHKHRADVWGSEAELSSIEDSTFGMTHLQCKIAGNDPKVNTASFNEKLKARVHPDCYVDHFDVPNDMVMDRTYYLYIPIPYVEKKKAEKEGDDEVKKHRHRHRSSSSQEQDVVTLKQLFNYTLFSIVSTALTGLYIKYIF